MDLCVGLDVIIAGTMDAMAGITDAAAVVDVVITTDAAAGIPSAKASARDTGRDTMMHCGTAAAAAVDAVAAADKSIRVMYGSPETEIRESPEVISVNPSSRY